MDTLLIRGVRPLSGELRVAGAKNAALPILAASLLSSEPVSVENLPHLSDVTTMLELLGCLGVQVTLNEKLTVEADASAVTGFTAPYELVRRMRASVLVLGPMLARFGRARVSFPGGCAIGSRPVDEHLRGLDAMGATVEISDGYIDARVAGRLQGAVINMQRVTVGGTENIMMAATLASGRTVIENAAREPEVVDLAQCLLAMGAQISGHGTQTIVVDGVERLHGCQYSVMPDRIEAGTYLIAACATRGRVLVRDVCPAHLEAVLQALRATQAVINVGDDWVEIDTQGRRPSAVSITTGPFPLFPTDLQAQFAALDTVAIGSSTVTDTVFEQRIGHVQQLLRMGADIRVEGNSVFITGRESLQGASVVATDLRASASLVIAGLVAQGKTRVDHMYHIDRGYERIEQKLQQLGAEMQRTPGRS